jgi:molecular chaperone GrpE (heat shock protein)
MNKIKKPRRESWLRSTEEFKNMTDEEIEEQDEYHGNRAKKACAKLLKLLQREGKGKGDPYVCD